MIDAHAHLLNLNYADIISRMNQDGLSYIINIGTSLQDSIAGQKLAQQHTNIYCTVGIHPEYANNQTIKQIDQIRHTAKLNKVVAIGEIGLDYHYDITDELKVVQKKLFIEQIKLANELNLPVVVHCRDAAEDCLQILKDNLHLLKYGFCMHCYSEGSAYAKKFESLGAYFSYTGNITYKKAETDYIKELPLDKIMVETDAPYLSPVPLRGTVNEPKNVILTAQKLASILEMPIEKVEKLLESNTKKFFNF